MPSRSGDTHTHQLGFIRLRGIHPTVRQPPTLSGRHPSVRQTPKGQAGSQLSNCQASTQPSDRYPPVRQTANCQANTQRSGTHPKCPADTQMSGRHQNCQAETQLLDNQQTVRHISSTRQTPLSWLSVHYDFLTKLTLKNLFIKFALTPSARESLFISSKTHTSIFHTHTPEIATLRPGGLMSW